MFFVTSKFSLFPPLMRPGRKWEFPLERSQFPAAGTHRVHGGGLWWETPEGGRRVTRAALQRDGQTIQVRQHVDGRVWNGC